MEAAEVGVDRPSPFEEPLHCGLVSGSGNLRRGKRAFHVRGVFNFRHVDYVTASAVVLLQKNLALVAVAGPLIRCVDIFCGLGFCDEAQDERGDCFDLVVLEREHRHHKPLVVALGVDLLEIVASRLAEFLEDEARSAVMNQTFVEEGRPQSVFTFFFGIERAR